MTSTRSLANIAACAAGVLAGCAVSDDPIRLLGTHALQQDCEASEFQLVRGSLDISSTSNYFIQFEMESSLQATTTESGGEQLAGANRNDFFAEEIVFTYSSTPSIPFEQERVSMHFVLPPEAARDQSTLNTSLIGPKAGQRLSDSLPNAGDELELLVTAQLRGKLASGQSVSSNTVDYPIHVFRSGTPLPLCAPGEVLTGGPCGTVGGQDGTVPVCGAP
ncbi:MAG: hypothetical protein ACOZIN_03725 [Myxococcota bacterium]